MKTLELNLQKILLIVEFEDHQHLQNVISCHNTGIRFMSDKDEPTKLICKGSELTEEICETLISKKDVAKNQSKMCSLNFKKGFISSIEAQGYYWGENPLGKEPKITEERYKAEREFMDNNPEESVFGDHYADWSMWKEAESKTFNLEKTLIFEIL